MRTYKQGESWRTEIVVDKTTSFSRPATEAEIAAATTETPAALTVDDLRGAVIAASEPEEDADTDSGEAEAPKRRGRPPKARE